MKFDKLEQKIENNILEYKSMSEKKRKRIEDIIKKTKEKKSVNLRVK